MTEKNETKFIKLAEEAGFVTSDVVGKQLLVAPYGDTICCAVATIDNLKRFYEIVVASVKNESN